MEPMTQRDVAEAIGISLGLANQILNLPSAPSPEKFRSRSSYLRRLCRAALKAGHQHDAILRGSNAPAKPATHLQPEPPAADISPASSSCDLADYTSSLANLRRTVNALGAHIAAGDPSRPEMQPILDRFAKLQQELRQSERHYIELQQAYAAIYPREDAQRAAIGIYMALRGALDMLISRLADPVHLQSWIVDAGGTVPGDSRAFQHRIRQQIYDLVAEQINQMADALAAAAVPEGMPADIPRESMIAELTRTMEALRR